MSSQRPAAEGIAPGHFPGPPVAAGHVEPCPRRIRVRSEGRWVLDTIEAFYVWEHPYYPQYAVPAAGLPDRLRAEARPTPDDPRLGEHVVLRFAAGTGSGIEWFEEDEQVHGHPRNPYVRVDALRSHRAVRVLAHSASGPPRLLADAPDAVAVFETGLPPRWYVDPTAVDLALLTASDTVTRCPYKGLTSDYWSTDGLEDVAWSYAAPTLALQSIAGLVSFDDSRVEVRVAER